MDDDVSTSSAQRLPVDAPAQFSTHKCGDDPCSQTGHESIRRQAGTIVHDVNLEPILVTACLDRHSAVTPVEPVLDGVGDQLGQHGGQSLGSVRVDNAERALQNGADLPGR